MTAASHKSSPWRNLDQTYEDLSTKSQLVPQTHYFGDVTFIGNPGLAAAVSAWIQTIENRILAGDEPLEATLYVRYPGEPNSDIFFGMTFGDKELACGGLRESSEVEANGIILAICYIKDLKIQYESKRSEELHEKIKPHLGKLEEADKLAFQTRLHGGESLIREVAAY